MKVRAIENWQHKHNYSSNNEVGERRTQFVLILTAITMVVEIVAGSVFGSMALLADGWHMGTHVAAFSITIYAYRYARRHASNPAYAFGTGKVDALGGYASAVALAVVALVMLVESLQRIIAPQEIMFNAAILVAIIGLLVNIVSAFALKDSQHHKHSHGHEHEHDHNLRAAYMHVLADALTSLLAIIALVTGKYFGWYWLDPLMGVVGALIITRWSYSLLKQTSPILLDASIDEKYKKSIVEVLEKNLGNQVSDIHIWKISSNHYAAIISIVTPNPKATEYYKSLLSKFKKLSHITIEIYSSNENK